MPHKIVSYNILSSALSTPSHFLHCDRKDLKSSRIYRTLAKIQGDIESRAIICLQEISLEQDAKLRALFLQHNYGFVVNHYGPERSGFMGVGIAYPRELYTEEKTEIRRLSTDMPRLSRKWRPGQRDSESPPTREMDAWKLARKSYNQVVFMRLRHKPSDATLVVATYHMPCKFWQPAMMVIQTAQLVASVRKFARTDEDKEVVHPYVIAGDFNFIPGSAPYRLMTEGSLPADDDHFPVDDGCGMKINHGVRHGSAYEEATGAEPEFTNLAKTKVFPERFCECLDYVFTSPGVHGVTAEALPSKAEFEDVVSLPTKTEPSDHLRLAVEVEVSSE